MRKMVKFALLGGILGAGVGYARSTKSEAPAEGTNEVVTSAAGGAAIGLGIGFVFDRRSARKAAKRRLTIGSALTAGGIVEAARAAIPVIEHAADVARERASKAAETAKPMLEKAVDAAKPAMEKAVDVAKPAMEKATARVAEKARTIDLTDGRVREAITVLT